MLESLTRCDDKMLEHTVSLRLGSKLSKDFKLIVDSCFGGNYDKALTEAVAILVKKEKLSSHGLEERDRVKLMKLVDKIFQGNCDQAVREALFLLLEKHKASVDE